MSNTHGVDVRQQRPQPGVVVVTVAGEIDMATAETMRTPITDRLRDADARLVIVDLSGVGFLASSGLAALIEAVHIAERRQVDLRLVVDSLPVRRALQITKLLDRFDTVPSVDVALHEWTESIQRRSR